MTNKEEILYLKYLIEANNSGGSFKTFQTGLPKNDNRKLLILRKLSKKYGIYNLHDKRKDYLDPFTSMDLGLNPPPTAAKYYKSKAYPPQAATRLQTQEKRRLLFQELRIALVRTFFYFKHY